MPQTSSPPPSRSSRALCSLISAWRRGEEREVLSFLPRVRRPRRLTLLPRPVSLATLHAAVLAAAGQPLDAAPASPARPPAPAPPPPALPERSPADGGGGGGAAGGGTDGGEGAGEGKVRVLVVDDDPGQRKVTRITPPVTRIPPPALPALSRAGEGHGPARPAYSNMPAPAAGGGGGGGGGGGLASGCAPERCGGAPPRGSGQAGPRDGARSGQAGLCWSGPPPVRCPEWGLHVPALCGSGLYGEPIGVGFTLP